MNKPHYVPQYQREREKALLALWWETKGMWLISTCFSEGRSHFGRFLVGRAGFGWFWVVSGGFGWFRLVSVIPFFSNNTPTITNLR